MTFHVEPDHEALEALVRFARVELESHDLEPWAEVLRHLRVAGVLDTEGALWAVKLYNAYDDLGSAWRMLTRWPSPLAWALDPDGDGAADYPCTQERRNLRGGLVLHHLDSYVGLLAGATQGEWIAPGLNAPPEVRFAALTEHLRRVWGTGRQAAFEWAEFLAKVDDVPVEATDAQLWESEGPRRSLQRLYRNDKPTSSWLDDVAVECRDLLAAEGVPLAWVDFETVICDYNVMRDGRYYPGRHLAALREEVEGVPEPARSTLLEAWHAVVPAPWADVAPGIDKALLGAFRETGKLVGPGGRVLEG